jgi:hypothetical protein
MHVTSLDFGDVLTYVCANLSSIASACDRPNEPDSVSLLSPGTDGLLQVLNLRHRLLSARYHFRRTCQALCTLSEKRRLTCLSKEANMEEKWLHAMGQHGEWESTLATAKRMHYLSIYL